MALLIFAFGCLPTSMPNASHPRHVEGYRVGAFVLDGPPSAESLDASLADEVEGGRPEELNDETDPSPSDDRRTGLERALEARDIQGLCEPSNGRWGYLTQSEQKRVSELIDATCKEMGVKDCRFFHLIAVRESGLRPYVRHRMAGDRKHALGAFVNNGTIYGWKVRRVFKAGRKGDLEKLDTGDLKIDPIEGREGNPYYDQPDRWTTGLGLHGLNVAHHLVKWDRMAPPEALCDPVVSTIVTIRIARRAVAHYNAKTWTEINAIFAGRQTVDYDDRGHAHARADLDPRKDAYFISRARSWGLNPNADPSRLLGTRLGLGYDPAQTEVADKIRGRSLPVEE